MRHSVMIGTVLLAMTSATLPAEEISLAGQWRFASDEANAGETSGWASPEFDDSAWVLKEVPADWGPFDGIGWYRTVTAAKRAVEDRVAVLAARLLEEKTP